MAASLGAVSRPTMAAPPALLKQACPVCHGCAHLALDEGPQALLEQVQHLANAVVIADGHGCTPSGLHWFIAPDVDFICPLPHGVAVIPRLHTQQRIHGDVEGFFEAQSHFR